MPDSAYDKARTKSAPAKAEPKKKAKGDDEHAEEAAPQQISVPKVPPTFLALDNVVVNLADTGGERMIQFRAEAFNVFNRVNLGNPVSALNSSNFGLITSASDPRIIQLALKYAF